MSQISDVRQAVAALMSQSGWQVRAHNPGDSAGSQSVVYFAEASAQQEFLALGGSKVETISLQGVARHVVYGASDADAVAAEEACLAIVADLETSFRSDVTVGATVMQAEFIGPVDSEVLAAEGQRVGVVTFGVVVRTVV
jgi:hypothetical protein